MRMAALFTVLTFGQAALAQPPTTTPHPTEQPPDAAPPDDVPPDDAPPDDVPPDAIPPDVEPLAPPAERELEVIPPQEEPPIDEAARARAAHQGNLILAGAILLGGGWIASLIPLITETCQDDDTDVECIEAQIRGELRDYDAEWGLLPIAGPWIIVNQTEDTGTDVFFGITGTAQIVGVVLLAVSAAFGPEAPVSEAARWMERGSFQVLSDGRQQVPGFTFQGRF